MNDIHARSLGTSAMLSGYYVETAIFPFDVINLLNKAGISFVLTGCHAIGGWMADPRTTLDVDLVVAVKHLKKATRILLEAYPHLEPVDLPVVIRLRDRETQNVVIDLMKPVQSLYRETFKHTHTVTAEGQTYRIPSLEMALAMKFAAMLSPNRAEEDRLQDAHDFISMVKKNAEIDTNRLADLGELVYGGGGAELAEMVRKVRAGEKLIL